MNRKFRKIIYRLTRKRLNENALGSERLSVSKEEVSYFNLSTNSIISFCRDGKTFFFRECPKILPRDDYFEAAISRFFASLNRLEVDKKIFSQELPLDLNFSDEVCEAFEKYIDERKNESDFYERLSKVDAVSEECGFSVWEETLYDEAFFEKFGFRDVGEELKIITVYFLWCMRSAAISFGTLGIAKGKEYSFFGAVRSICSRIVAEELGVPHLITDARPCLLEIDGEGLFGILSDAAPGKRMADISVAPNGAFQRELLYLNAVDVVCFQPDHGPNNYNVCKVGEKEYSVCAFDNDNPSTFFPFPKASVSLAGCSPLVNGDGTVNRPFFDLEFAENIKKINIKKLKNRLRPYLNGVQIFALTRRLNGLKKAIEKTAAVKPEFLLQADEWNDFTVSEELSGKYGVTYLEKSMKRGQEEQEK